MEPIDEDQHVGGREVADCRDARIFPLRHMAYLQINVYQQMIVVMEAILKR